MIDKPLTPQEFKQIYSKVPRVTTTLVVRAGKGIVLSLRSLDSWYGLWHLPGGMIYYQESVIDTVHRIAREELGIEIKVIKLLDYLEYPSEIKERGFGCSVDLIFLCKYHGLEFKPNNESSEVKIFNEIPKNTVIEQSGFLKKYWSEIFSQS